MIKALFFDIDGTLVSFRTHRIPASTIEALTRAQAQDIQIFIATGRPPVLINNLGDLQERHLISGYITMNGGYCFVGDEVIYKSAIPRSDAATLLHYCTERQIACVVVYEKDICVCHADAEMKQVFHDFLKVDFITDSTPDEVLRSPQPIYQMTPFISPEQEAEIRPRIPHCEIGRWYPSFADLTALGNTKQHGIDQVISRFGIGINEVMAFGDGGNDTGMLRHAGIGVAMGNASAEVQAAADFVTTTVDDNGIEHALRHFGII